MQTFEALVSLLLFISFLFTISSYEGFEKTEVSLYRYQLANDVWRVLYLRGDLSGYSDDMFNLPRMNAEKDLERITELTSLCVSLRGVRVQSPQCRSEESAEEKITIHKKMFVGNEIKEVSLSVYPDYE